MAKAVLLAAALATAYAGFAVLACTQQRHWHMLTGTVSCPKRQKALLRCAGAALLLLALALAIARDGAAFGSLLWGTAISLAAIAVVLTLTWFPSRLRSALSVLLTPSDRMEHP